MLADFLQREVERTIKRALRPFVAYLRMLFVGLNLIVLALVSYIFTLGFASVGLYFLILHTTVNAVAVFWVSGVWLVIAALLTALGSSKLRPPR